MGALALTSNLMRSLSLRWSYVIGGAIITLSAFFFLRLSTTLGATTAKQPRIVLKRGYWRFYVLKFFEGSRKEILGSFCTLVLVQQFGWKVWQLSTLMLARSVVTLVLAPYLGMVVDRFGPKRALMVSYTTLTLACIAYATTPYASILAALYLVIRLGQILNLGLNVYVHEEAPPEELSPTLSAGVSINHISSVAMPLIFGVLMPVIGYSGVYLMSAVIIGISIIFVTTMRSGAPASVATVPVMAE
jgi:predicted MFS family arabinose efflux permease